MANTISFHTNTTDSVMTLTATESRELARLALYAATSGHDTVTLTLGADLRRKIEAFAAAAT